MNPCRIVMSVLQTYPTRSMSTPRNKYGYILCPGAGSPHHAALRGEGKVDPAGGDGRGDDAAGVELSVGFFNGAVGRGNRVGQG